MKSTPIYVKPQLSSDSGTCRISLLVGIKNDPGKPIDEVSVQFQLPNCVLSADLSSNLGTVNILTDKVLPSAYYLNSSKLQMNVNSCGLGNAIQ